MSKEAIKRKVSNLQNGKCKLSKKILSYNTSLFDIDRKKTKATGGDITIDNINVVNPIEHMKKHGNLRTRPEILETLKSIIDDRNQLIKLKVKINNQILAYKRQTDVLSELTLKKLIFYLKDIDREVTGRDNLLKLNIKEMSEIDTIVKAMSNVKGIGPVTIAYCIVYLDIEKARHISSFWKYVGLHCASHERYEKGISSGGNKTLRTVLYTMALSQIKLKGPYREIYDQTKKRLEKSNKIVKSRNTQGKMIEIPWKETKKCHRNGAAIRKIMKYFLSDLWIVWRKLYEMPTENTYATDVLGGHKMSLPENRGWIY